VCVCLHMQMPVIQKLIYFVNLKAFFFLVSTRENLKELYHVSLMVSEECSLFQIISIVIVLYAMIFIKVVGQI